MKHKVLAILLCLAMVLTMALPGTLAVSADEDSSESQLTTDVCTCGAEDDIHAEDCPLCVQPELPEEEPVCTCGAEDDNHAEDCPLYVQPELPEEEPVCTCGTEDDIHAEDCPLYDVDDDSETEEPTESTEDEEEPEGTPPESWGSASLAGAVSFTNVAPLIQFDYGIATLELDDEDYGIAPVAENDNGVVLNKTAKTNANGGFDITLEAYATGSEVTVSHYEPADIVLVLDISGSMNYAMDNTDRSSYTPVYGSSTANSGGDYAYGLDTSKANYYYVQNSSGTFVRLSYNAQAGDSKHGWFTDADWRGTRIQPTTSATDTNRNRTQVYVVAQGGSRLDVLKEAVNQFIDDTLQTSEDSRIAVVSFSGKIDSDYPPKSTRVSGFSSDSSALQTAVNRLEANGATYSNYGMQEAVTLLQELNNDRKKVVIMFTDGAPSETNAFSENVANGAISASYGLKQAGVTVYTIGVFEGANGSLGSENNSDINKYMHYVSSNYPDAQNFTNGGDRNEQLTGDDSYYLSASNSAELNTIFQKISNQVGGATNTTLGTSTVVKDIIAPSFTVPADTSDIKIYTANCTGAGLTFGNRTPATGVTATITGDTLDVTGFDFSNNWCGNHSGTYSGKKLIIEFTVSPKEGFLGGNGVPTNGNSSGLYSNGTPVGLFEVPTVNVPIEDITIEAKDKNVYLTQVPTDDQLKTGVTIKCGNVDITDPSKLEDWQKVYVDIESILTKSDSFNATVDGTYTVTATVNPKVSGDSSKPGTVATKQTGTETKAIHVFKPELTYKDSDVYYGDKEPASYDSNLTKTEWKHGNTLDTAVTMIGTQPTLALTYTPEVGKIVSNKIATKKDFAVNVAVKIGQTDVGTYAAFQHTDCTGKTCGKPESGKFWLHVKTCQLTITKTGGANKESYVFDVYKDGEKYTEVTIWGNGSETIYELPVGNYTIQENTGWSWRYDANNGSAATLSAQNTSGSITCTNTSNTDKWLNGFSTIVKNIFGVTNEQTGN